MGKFIDMTGRRYERITVLRKHPEKSRCNHILWECICDCGTKKILDGQDLRSGKVKSCGCLNKEVAAAKNKKDLTNQIFGKLLALEPTEERANGYIVWKCQCECGNIINIPTNSLTTGNTTSCGCIHSRGEEYISKLLQLNNISYQNQKSYKDCISPSTGRALRFDFLVEEKYLIEYDGILHFETEEHGWNSKENLEKTQLHDKIKNEYCFNNNIPLIRIPYTHLPKLCLEDLLLETSQFIIKKQED